MVLPITICVVHDVSLTSCICQVALLEDYDRLRRERGGMERGWQPSAGWSQTDEMNFEETGNKVIL